MQQQNEIPTQPNGNYRAKTYNTIVNPHYSSARMDKHDRLNTIAHELYCLGANLINRGYDFNGTSQSNSLTEEIEIVKALATNETKKNKLLNIYSDLPTYKVSAPKFNSVNSARVLLIIKAALDYLSADLALACRAELTNLLFFTTRNTERYPVVFPNDSSFSQEFVLGFIVDVYILANAQRFHATEQDLMTEISDSVNASVKQASSILGLNSERVKSFFALNIIDHDFSQRANNFLQPSIFGQHPLLQAVTTPATPPDTSANYTSPSSPTPR